MSGENKTEQPTPRRRQKARESGQIARSRELPSALVMAAGIAVLAWRCPSLVWEWRSLLRRTLDVAAQNETVVRAETMQVMFSASAIAVAPVALSAFVVAMAASVAQGGFIFAPASLVPKGARLNPAQKLSQMFSLNAVSALLKSLIPGAGIAYFGTSVIAREWPKLLAARSSTAAGTLWLFSSVAFEIAWKSALVMLAWAGADYLLVRRKFESDLRMTKEEIKQEMKETDGNPLIKARIRRIQRQVRRSRMLQDVQRARVVVTNPTHFAVALEYQVDMACPVVVAKGRDALAQQIKQVAIWHGVAIVENPPLAQALYRTVEVGQSIPSKLYVAVAEVLAFVYRVQRQASSGRSR